MGTFFTKVKLNSTNQEEFDREHLDWSTQLAEVQRTKEITYTYNPLFIEEVEKPIKCNGSIYKPYILKTEVLEVQTPPIFLDFPPNIRLITRNPFSLHCVETVLPIFS